MSYSPISDTKFLGALEAWLNSRSEILVLIRFSYAAGSRSFELYTSFQELQKRMRELPPLTCVTAFKEPQIPLRVVVDDEFMAKCLSCIPEDAEYLLVETIPTVAGRVSWFHHDEGETHASLRESLEKSRGKPVAVGVYPPWLKDSEVVVSAVVPDANGVTGAGVY